MGGSAKKNGLLSAMIRAELTKDQKKREMNKKREEEGLPPLDEIELENLMTQSSESLIHDGVNDDQIEEAKTRELDSSETQFAVAYALELVFISGTEFFRQYWWAESQAHRNLTGFLSVVGFFLLIFTWIRQQQVRETNHMIYGPRVRKKQI